MNQTINCYQRTNCYCISNRLYRDFRLPSTYWRTWLPAVRTAAGRCQCDHKGQNDEQQRYVTAHVDTAAIVRAVKPMAVSNWPYWWFGTWLKVRTVRFMWLAQVKTVSGPSIRLLVMSGKGWWNRRTYAGQYEASVCATNEKETRAMGIEIAGITSFGPANCCDRNWFYQVSPLWMTRLGRCGHSHQSLSCL